MPISKHTRNGVVRKHVKRPNRKTRNRHSQKSVVICSGYQKR